MDRKSTANERPVHSPIGCRHAKKRKGNQTETRQNNNKQNRQTAANKNKNKQNIACDRGPYIAHCKRFCLFLLCFLSSFGIVMVPLDRVRVLQERGLFWFIFSPDGKFPTALINWHYCQGPFIAAMF